MRFLHWFAIRWKRTFEEDKQIGFIAFSGVWAASTWMALLASYGSPLGIHTGLELFIVYFINSAALGLISCLLAVILSLMMAPVPRFLTGGALYTTVLTYKMLHYAKLGSFMSVLITIVYVLLAIAIGMLLASVVNKRNSKRLRVFSLTGIVALIAGIVLIVQVGSGPSIHYTTDKGTNEPISVTAPSEPGPYTVEYFTYGSGLDQHRPEFGEQAKLISSSVDASDMTRSWKWKRKLFWGFDETELPLNGRVWMPEGEGDFPLVLIVHGNAIAEYFSDDGYRYLGELLASKGMIAISVDENYLNYSQWSSTPKNDMLIRAWILVKHLQQIGQFSMEEENPFYAKVDWDNVGLVGHSRGGQAIVMAANYASWFEDDESLNDLPPFNIKALVSLAGTDNKVDATGSYRLNDVYYLSIQGAMDADVSNFYGARQYNRTTIPAGSDRFKASLYIAGVSHSPFNTDWGTMDLRVPGGLFLTKNNMLHEEDQRSIAKTYISAFFETALLGNDTYRPLFQDYRYGLDWGLPETRYFSRYEDGAFQVIARFDGSSDTPESPGRHTATVQQVTASIEQAKHRRGSNIGTKGLELEWSDEGSYTLELSTAIPSSATELIFSMANLEHELLELGEGPEHAAIELELEQANGESTRLPLATFMPLYRSIETTFTWLPMLEPRMKNKAYQNAAEATFQTFHLPLEAFRSEEGEITSIIFHFTDGPGKVLLDDIGWK